MVRNFDGAGALIEQWLKNKERFSPFGVWERIKIGSISLGGGGFIASAGRCGGTFAHKDIAIEFGSWLSP
jgi:hypothetical protein